MSERWGLLSVVGEALKTIGFFVLGVLCCLAPIVLVVVVIKWVWETF